MCEGSDEIVSLFLCKDILYLCDDLRSSLNEVCDLINGIGLTLLRYVDKVNGTVAVYYEKSYGIYGDAGSAATAEILRTGLSVLLGIVVKSACGNAHGDLGDGNYSCALRGVDGVSYDLVCVKH